MSRAGRVGIGVVLTACIAPTAQSAPALIHDAGGTRALAPLAIAAGLIKDPGEPEPAAVEAPMTPRPDRYAVVSPGLSVGVQRRLATGAQGRYLARPLFLIGADQSSLAWLAQHHQRLRALGAAGLLVAAQGEADYRRALEAAAGLALAVGSGQSLAEHFGITHYPVLIGPQWIEQ